MFCLPKTAWPPTLSVLLGVLDFVFATLVQFTLNLVK